MLPDDDYLTWTNGRLLVLGAVAGGLVAWGWHRFVDRRVNATAVALAIVVGAAVAGVVELPHEAGRVASAAAIGALAVIGVVRVWRGRSGWIPSLASLGGVFLAVPENGPVVVIAAALAGIAAVVVGTRGSFSPSASAAIAGGAAWAVLEGAAPTTVRFTGALLCLGLLPWLGVVAVVRGRRRAPQVARWVLLPHAVLAVAAARWIAVDPAAGWDRVAILAAAAAVIAAVAWRRA